MMDLPASAAEHNAGAPQFGKPMDSPSAPGARIPPEDLKPLYDFAVGCRACQAELAVAQANLKDEQGKTAAVGKERDSALQLARGGSVLKRVMRAAKWFAIGFGVGAVAVKVAR
jgi:hypothetical protein